MIFLIDFLFQIIKNKIRRLIKMNEELSFDPFFLFKSSFRQTIMGYLMKPMNPRSTRKLIDLPDNDKLSIEITTPKTWDENKVVVMVHGLCGSHKSPTLVRMTRKLSFKKMKVIRANLRNCGSGKGFSKKIYHCGTSEDIFEVIKFIKKENNNSKIILVGFSLGGNIVLKMVGELKENAKDYLNQVIALSPPVDILSSTKLFEKPENKLYLKHFSKLLKEDVKYLQKRYKDFPKIKLPNNMNIHDFNEKFIVPFFGFENLDDYYKKASAKYFVKDIKIPCKILLSEDDPIVSSKSLDDVKIPDNINIYKTKNGGHLGYLGKFNDKRGFYWLDNLLLDWICSS
jgi:predicted alpha/beta-fold hydrolase